MNDFDLVLTECQNEVNRLSEKHGLNGPIYSYAYQFGSQTFYTWSLIKAIQNQNSHTRWITIGVSFQYGDHDDFYWFSVPRYPRTEESLGDSIRV